MKLSLPLSQKFYFQPEESKHEMGNKEFISKSIKLGNCKFVITTCMDHTVSLAILTSE